MPQSPALARIDSIPRWALALACSWLSLVASPQAQAAPTELISTGVNAIADGMPWWNGPEVIWYSQPGCAPAPPGAPEEAPFAAGGGAAPGDASAPGDELLPAIIQRTSTYLSPTRKIMYFNPARAAGVCNPYRLLSNIESDADALYFLDNQGPGGVIALWRRLRHANVADASTLLKTYPGVPADFSGELQVWNGVLFLIGHSGFDVMVQYDKLTGQLLNGFVAAGNRFAMSNMQVDQRFLWWLNAGALWRNDLTNGAQIVAHPGFIDTYEVEFYNEECNPIDGCSTYSRVVVGRNNQLALLDMQIAPVPTIYPLFPLYTSTDPNARITSITRDSIFYFFFERRAIGGGFSREDWLFRLGSSPQLIYGPVNNGGPGFSGLRTDDSHLYFVDRAAGSLLKLANNAAAIPLVTLRATGLEVTQGLQDPAHNVRLVNDRRTFVRLYHRSDGASSVGNVAAVLDVSGPGGYLGRLDPVNSVGKLLTARTSPSRLTLDDSFVFELPLAWTSQPSLSFTGTVNPNRIQLELDLANNSASRTVSLEPSPRLPLELVKFAFNYGGTLQFGGTFDDFNAVHWIRRLYPLAYVGGGIGYAGPGLRTSSRLIFDDGIVSWVDQSNADCKKKYQDTKKGVDNRNMCAVDYALGRIRALRAAGDLPSNWYYYAMIAQGAGIPFTRGFAPGGDKISGGPSNDVNYMSHEVGHTLGRGHPASGAAPVCPGQSADDPGFPNPRARIGSSTTGATDGTALLGFDTGDFGSRTNQLLPSSGNGDTMSYCSPYWISEYHYEGMLDFMNANPANGPDQVGAPIAGDWLIAVGGLSTDTASGAFNELRRTDAVAEVSALVPGAFRLELRDGAAVLASHSFTPDTNPDATIDAQSFALVVPFEPGTTQIRVVENGTNRVYFSKNVSANAPVVSNVALVSPPDPVTGTVTLGWDAIDDDGDVLRFDVLRTLDGGLSFEPVALSISANTVDLDTAAWGGGSSALRVIASDGVLSGVGDGAAFMVEAKAPVVRIITPEDARRVPWNTLVNFSAEITDPQQAPLLDADIVWSNAYRVLGTGPVISPTDLEVGTNIVTVSVTNAAGLNAQASVTVVVGDDLRLPGPKLSVTPTTIPFSVAATELNPQAGGISITNAGGGNLSVTVTSDSGWLLLDGDSGGVYAAPSTIALLVDPTVLPDASVSTASITIQNNADPSDVLIVPVTLAKGAVFTATPFVDDDADGIENGLDNCAFVSNADQADTGGLGSGSAPDGIGDACQCGDLNGDGRVSVADAVVLQRSLLQPPTATPARPDLCDVGGSAGCSLPDAIILRRALLSPPTAFITPACVIVPTP